MGLAPGDLEIVSVWPVVKPALIMTYFWGFFREVFTP